VETKNRVTIFFKSMKFFGNVRLTITHNLKLRFFSTLNLTPISYDDSPQDG